MTFTSLGKAANSIIVAVVRKFVLLLPLTYLMPHIIADQTKGVYMADVLNASQIQKLQEVLVKRYAIIGVMLKKCSKQ